MTYKTILVGVLLAGSMHHTWAMDGQGDSEVRRLKTRISDLEKEVALLRNEVNSIKHNKDHDKEFDQLVRTVNMIKSALEQRNIIKTHGVRSDDDME